MTTNMTTQVMKQALDALKLSSGDEYFMRSTHDAIQAAEVALREAIAANEIAALKAAQPVELAQATSELEKAARDAAQSLETIYRLAGRETYGSPPIETYMSTFVEVRGYAKSRATAAKEEIEAAMKYIAQPAPAAPYQVTHEDVKNAIEATKLVQIKKHFDWMRRALEAYEARKASV